MLGCGVAVLLIAEDPWPWPSLTVAAAWVLASVVHVRSVSQPPRRR